MPPWSGMGKDLRALAKAAKLDTDAEDDSLTRELLATPAIARSPAELWTTFRPSLVRLGKKDGTIRDQLRQIFPAPRNSDDDKRKKLVTEWLELLDEVGALGDIPDAGLAEWLGKLIRWAGSTPRVVALLGELAPRIKEPIAVVVKQGWWERLDLDLAERALELGLTLADPGDDDFGPDAITCDPVRVAAHPIYGKKLVECVAGMMGEAEHEPKMRGKPGFTAARRAWLEAELENVDKGALKRFEDALDELESKTDARTFLEFPDLYARLSAAKVAPALRKVLAEGVFDELGWPAFEQAREKLDGEDLEIVGAFPWLVIHNARHATVLGPEGVVLEHDFVSHAKNESVQKAIFVDGQLFVVVRDNKNYDSLAYWSSAPKNRFEPKGSGWHEIGVETRLADGSVTLGNRAFRAGDTELGWFRRHAFDGTQVFVHEYSGGASGFREYDPRTGKMGRNARPTFFESYVAPNMQLSSSCALYAVPLATSPLGVKDGMYGLRIRTDDNRIEAERIDGVSYTGATSGASVEALLTLPARAEPIPLDETSGDLGSAAYLRLPDGELLADLSEHKWASRGFGGKLPPLGFWHYLTPRDEAGSRALRKVSEADAAKLLAAAAKDLEAHEDDEDGPLPKAEAAAKALGIKNERLARGVAGVAGQAAKLEKQLAELVEERSKEAADTASVEGKGEKGTLIAKADAAMKRGKGTIEDFDIDLPDWLQKGRGKAMIARAPLADAETFKDGRDVLAGLLATSFVDDLSNLRVLRIETEDDYDDKTEWNALRIAQKDGSTFAIHASDDWALERSTDGTLRVPVGFKLTDEQRPGRGIGRDFVEAYLALGDTPAKWEPTDVDLVAEASGLSRAEAGLLLFGAPGVDGYERDFLGKARREALGLKMNEAEAARGLFKDMKAGVLDQIFDKAAEDLTALDGAAWAKRLGAAFREVVGEKVQLPEGLVLEAQKDLTLETSLTKLLAAVASPKSIAASLEPGKWTTLTYANSYISDPGEDGFDQNLARELVLTMCWVSLATPVGDPVRAGIPKLLALLEKAVRNPKLVWGLGNKYSEKKDKKDILSLLDLVKGKQVLHEKDDDDECEDGRDTGILLLGRYGERLLGAFRPAKVERWDDPTMHALAKGLMDADDDDGSGPAAIAVAAMVLGKDLAALAARVADTPVAAGEWEANPRLSAPKTVAAVKKAHGISDEAATLYLQLLALAEPTQKAVQKWNGWAPKVYGAAVTELAKKKLVVEGKRERAQREVFLPGGFSKGEGKNLPMEDWKRAFYPKTFPRNLPTEPLHALFARAWKRVEGGDAPKFEKVR